MHTIINPNVDKDGAYLIKDNDIFKLTTDHDQIWETDRLNENTIVEDDSGFIEGYEYFIKGGPDSIENHEYFIERDKDTIKNFDLIYP